MSNFIASGDNINGQSVVIVEKFTPGPWFLSPSATYIRAEGVHGWNIAKIEDQQPYTNANAKLISVAPGMYEALKEAEKELQEAGQFMSGNDSDIINHWGKGLLSKASSIRELLEKATQ